MTPSRFWLVAAISALLMFGLPLAVMTASAKREPEVRLILTGAHFSALLITDSSRTLVINSNDRGATRSAIGYLARPWEPKISTIVAPADDRAAIGLWEALRLPSITQVIIVGLPGSDPLWSIIERECRERNIQIQYVGEPALVHMPAMDVTLFPPTPGSAAHIMLQRDNVTASLALAGGVPSSPVHAAIANRRPEAIVASDLLILPATQQFQEQANAIYVRDREVVALLFSSTSITVQGGRLQSAAEPVN